MTSEAKKLLESSLRFRAAEMCNDRRYGCVQEIGDKENIPLRLSTTDEEIQEDETGKDPKRGSPQRLFDGRSLDEDKLSPPRVKSTKHRRWSQPLPVPADCFEFASPQCLAKADNSPNTRSQSRRRWSLQPFGIDGNSIMATPELKQKVHQKYRESMEGNLLQYESTIRKLQKEHECSIKKMDDLEKDLSQWKSIAHNHRAASEEFSLQSQLHIDLQNEQELTNMLSERVRELEQIISTFKPTYSALDTTSDVFSNQEYGSSAAKLKDFRDRKSENSSLESPLAKYKSKILALEEEVCQLTTKITESAEYQDRLFHAEQMTASLESEARVADEKRRTSDEDRLALQERLSAQEIEIKMISTNLTDRNAAVEQLESEGKALRHRLERNDQLVKQLELRLSEKTTTYIQLEEEYRILKLEIKQRDSRTAAQEAEIAENRRITDARQASQDQQLLRTKQKVVDLQEVVRDRDDSLLQQTSACDRLRESLAYFERQVRIGEAALKDRNLLLEKQQLELQTLRQQLAAIELSAGNNIILSQSTSAFTASVPDTVAATTAAKRSPELKQSNERRRSPPTSAAASFIMSPPLKQWSGPAGLASPSPRNPQLLFAGTTPTVRRKLSRSPPSGDKRETSMTLSSRVKVDANDDMVESALSNPTVDIEKIHGDSLKRELSKIDGVNPLALRNFTWTSIVKAFESLVETKREDGDVEAENESTPSSKLSLYIKIIHVLDVVKKVRVSLLIAVLAICCGSGGIILVSQRSKYRMASLKHFKQSNVSTSAPQASMDNTVAGSSILVRLAGLAATDISGGNETMLKPFVTLDKNGAGDRFVSVESTHIMKDGLFEETLNMVAGSPSPPLFPDSQDSQAHASLAGEDVQQLKSPAAGQIAATNGDQIIEPVSVSVSSSQDAPSKSSADNVMAESLMSAAAPIPVSNAEGEIPDPATATTPKPSQAPSSSELKGFAPSSSSRMPNVTVAMGSNRRLAKRRASSPSLVPSVAADVAIAAAVGVPPTVTSKSDTATSARVTGKSNVTTATATVRVKPKPSVTIKKQVTAEKSKVVVKLNNKMKSKSGSKGDSDKISSATVQSMHLKLWSILCIGKAVMHARLAGVPKLLLRVKGESNELRSVIEKYGMDAVELVTNMSILIYGVMTVRGTLAFARLRDGAMVARDSLAHNSWRALQIARSRGSEAWQQLLHSERLHELHRQSLAALRIIGSESVKGLKRMVDSSASVWEKSIRPRAAQGLQAARRGSMTAVKAMLNMIAGSIKGLRKLRVEGTEAWSRVTAEAIAAAAPAVEKTQRSVEAGIETAGLAHTEGMTRFKDNRWKGMSGLRRVIESRRLQQQLQRLGSFSMAMLYTLVAESIKRLKEMWATGNAFVQRAVGPEAVEKLQSLHLSTKTAMRSIGLHGLRRLHVVSGQLQDAVSTLEQPSESDIQFLMLLEQLYRTVARRGSAGLEVMGRLETARSGPRLGQKMGRPKPAASPIKDVGVGVGVMAVGGRLMVPRMFAKLG